MRLQSVSDIYISMKNRLSKSTHLIAVSLLVCASWIGTASAQDIQSSILSRYGYGVLAHPAPTALKGMGGVGVALSGPKFINLTNPAAYAASDSLSFLMDIAVSANWGRYSDGSEKKNTFLGNFDYIAFQFPLWKDRLVFSTGLTPFSTTGYGLSSKVNVKDVDDVYSIVQDFSGSGSIQSLYAGMGFKVWRGLSLGANVRYLFGKTIHNVTNVPGSTLISTTRDSHTLRLSNVLMDLGAQYRMELSKDKALRFGATFAPSMKLTPEIVLQHEESYGSINLPQITQRELKEATRSPLRAALGVAYEGGAKLLVSGDVELVKWGSVPNIFENDAVILKDAYRVAIGTQYRPDLYSRRYSDRILYRGGVSFDTSYASTPGIGQMNMLGVSLGLGLPINVNDERTSYVDLALEYRTSLPSASKVLREDCLKVSLSFNFNETWFRKLRIY